MINCLDDNFLICMSSGARENEERERVREMGGHSQQRFLIARLTCLFHAGPCHEEDR